MVKKLVPQEESDNLTVNDLPNKGERGEAKTIETPEVTGEDVSFSSKTKTIKPDDSFLKDIPEEEESEDEVLNKKVRKTELENDEDNPRIPQKRFDRVYKEREDYKRQLDDSNKRIDKLADMLEKSLTASQQKAIERTTPDKWKKILGEDNPLTDQFYALLDEEMTSREQRAAETAIKQWEDRQQQSTAQVTERVESLRKEQEEFASTVGIDVSTEQGDEELAKILEIQDQLTPQDEDGAYVQPLVPLNVAYELYKARSATAVNPQKQKKFQAASIVASGRGGDVEASRNAPKGRPDPGGWRKFLS